MGPTVVVLNKGDLTEEEAKAVVEKESDEPPPDGKIKFKSQKKDLGRMSRRSTTQESQTRKKANCRRRACCLSMKTRKMRSTDSKLSYSVESTCCISLNNPTYSRKK